MISFATSMARVLLVLILLAGSGFAGCGGAATGASDGGAVTPQQAQADF